MSRWHVPFRARTYVRGSLWIVPVLGGLAGALLAQAVLAIDSSTTLPPGWRYSESTASTVLSVIVGAMVGLTGIVVAIGLLIVQAATGTLSPRFMRLWYRDRLQKAVLACFIGTLGFASAGASSCRSARRWEEYLELGVTEIREYGRGAPQVTRRLRATLESLLASGPARAPARARARARASRCGPGPRARRPPPARLRQPGRPPGNRRSRARGQPADAR